MAILAHPDDETAGMGGTFAFYEQRGVRASLLVATRGGRGWMAPEEDGPGPEALARIRERELEAAASVLGIDEVHYLDYMDGDLDRAEPREAIAKIVAHLRRFRPQVVVTFAPDGVHGHPDHIAISQLTSAALVAAADSSYLPADGHPHRTPKFYCMADSKEVIQPFTRVAGDLKMEVDGVTRQATYWMDWAITPRIPTEPYRESTLRALQCHRSQLAGFGDLDSIPEDQLRIMLSGGTSYRVYSLVNGGRAVETDLFTGISQAASPAAVDRLAAQPVVLPPGRT